MYKCITWDCTGSIRETSSFHMSGVIREQGTGFNFGMAALELDFYSESSGSYGRFGAKEGVIFWCGGWEKEGEESGMTLQFLAWEGVRMEKSWVEIVNKLVMGLISGVRFWQCWICDTPKTSKWQYQPGQLDTGLEIRRGIQVVDIHKVEPVCGVEQSCMSELESLYVVVAVPFRGLLREWDTAEWE